MTSSPEPKARATADAFAERLGMEVSTDDRLVEAHRPWVGDGYRYAAHRYLSGDEPEGWEPRREVADRIAAAIAELREDVGPGELVVVGHGLGLSLHLEDIFRGPFDPYGFWCRLAFPDAWRVDRHELHAVAGGRPRAPLIHLPADRTTVGAGAPAPTAERRPVGAQERCGGRFSRKAATPSRASSVWLAAAMTSMARA